MYGPTARSLIVMRYSPSAGKLCLNLMPSRVPGGSGIVGILIGRDGVLHTRNAWVGTADREPRHVPRRGNVLIEERGRHAQGGRDIVEALHLDVLRQNFLRVHVHAHQRFHRRGVLGAVQALDRHIARRWARDLWHGCRECSPSRRQTNPRPSASVADCPAAASDVRAACAGPFPRSARHSRAAARSSPSNARPPVFRRALWQVTQ